nr:hypothetical protein [Gammaproteobacteria bacterium]
MHELLLLLGLGFRLVGRDERELALLVGLHIEQLVGESRRIEADLKRELGLAAEHRAQPQFLHRRRHDARFLRVVEAEGHFALDGTVDRELVDIEKLRLAFLVPEHFRGVLT